MYVYHDNVHDRGVLNHVKINAKDKANQLPLYEHALYFSTFLEPLTLIVQTSRRDNWFCGVHSPLGGVINSFN